MINRRNISIFLLLLVCHTMRANQINIIFRYDDYTLEGNPVKDSIVALFFKHNIPLVLGIIPFDSNDEPLFGKNFNFAHALSSAVKDGRIEIALHGYNHELINGEAEFSRLDYKEQVRRVKRGKSFLDSIFQTNVVSFIPPWNVYDHNTFKALHENGFHIISSSLANLTSDQFDFCYFPYTTEEMDHVRTLISDNINREGIIVVMFNPYDPRPEELLQNIDEVLTEIKRNKNLKLSTFKNLSEDGNCISKKQIQAHWRKNLLSKMLKMDGMIYPLKYIEKVRIANVIMHLLFSMIAFLVSFKIFNPQKIGRLVFHISVLLYGIVLFFVVYNELFSPLKLLFLTLVFSFTIPMLFSLIHKFRH
ncbi:MAG TPA: DUF2334 domain-containing protein [Prolixibacteraceae bacterium]|nr:DUF2334 domain-containing protein [Prolixibacteraceae bacterium]HOG96608.1 DUF2334 domain-containing protein [Prolixibacteraceae bacterium]